MTVNIKLLSKFLCVHTLLFLLCYYLSDIANFKGDDTQYDCNKTFSDSTNYFFFITTSIIVSSIDFTSLHLYHPYVYLYMSTLNVAISSTIYHTSNDYSITGLMDVSSIVPVIFHLLWFMVWIIYTTKRPPHTNPIVHFMLVSISIVLYGLVYNYSEYLDWTTKYGIYSSMIISVLIMATIVLLYTQELCILIKTIASFIPIFIIAIIFLSQPDKFKCEYHGFFSHVFLSTLINILVVFTTDLFKQRFQSQNS